MTRWVRRGRGRHQIQLVCFPLASASLVLTVVSEARQARYKRAATGWCAACQLSPSLTCQAHALDMAEVNALGDVAAAIKLQMPKE